MSCDHVKGRDGQCEADARYRIGVSRYSTLYACRRHLASLIESAKSSMFTVDKLDAE